MPREKITEEHVREEHKKLLEEHPFNEEKPLSMDDRHGIVAERLDTKPELVKYLFKQSIRRKPKPQWEESKRGPGSPPKREGKDPEALRLTSIIMNINRIDWHKFKRLGRERIGGDMEKEVIGLVKSMLGSEKCTDFHFKLLDREVQEHIKSEARNDSELLELLKKKGIF